MAIVPLLKPATLGTAVLQIWQYDDDVTMMSLKIQACDINYTQVVENTTGSSNTTADTWETYEGSGLCGGTIALQGLLIADKVASAEGSGTDFIGIQNMFSKTTKYSRMRWSVGLASGLYLQGTMIVNECRIRWVRSAATVQMTISGKITDTDPSLTESSAAYTT